MKEFLNFISGEYVRNASGKTFQDINPVNNSVIGNIYETGEVEVNAAVAAAKICAQGVGPPVGGRALQAAGRRGRRNQPPL